MNDSQLPDELNMTGKMNGREFDLQLGRGSGDGSSVIFDGHPAMLQFELAKCPELLDPPAFRKLPVIRSNGTTLHALAAPR